MDAPSISHIFEYAKSCWGQPDSEDLPPWFAPVPGLVRYQDSALRPGGLENRFSVPVDLAMECIYERLPDARQ
jgi:hypothetical protein